jgi:hypothetical protein
MRSKKQWIPCILYILLGAALLVLGVIGVTDAFWSGMGGALIAVGAVRIVQYVRLSKDSDYREQRETEYRDERNQFIRTKAWAWAGYLFILIAAVASIVLRILGQNLLSMAASSAVCLLMVLFWLCDLFLQKKY